MSLKGKAAIVGVGKTPVDRLGSKPGEPYIGEYHEYFCPGCAAQLQVDLFCPPLGAEPILWDIRPSISP